MDGLAKQISQSANEKRLVWPSSSSFSEELATVISWLDLASSRMSVRAHEPPLKHPHFHAKIFTTSLQPERPLSRNMKKL